MKLQSRFRWVSIVSLICAAGFGWSAAQKRPITIVDLLNVASLSDPRLSPEGDSALYVLSESDWKANRQVPHIWRTDLQSGESIQLTRGEQGESSPRWSPDGKSIAFLTRRDPAKSRQIYLLRTSGGEAEQLTNHETAVSDIAWTPDGAALYFLASDPKTEEEKKREEAKDDVFAFDENYKQEHLWRFELEGREERRITEGDFSILSYELSRDGSRIVFHRAPTPLFDDSDESEVWIMGADGNQPLKLTSNAIAESQAGLSPDGTRVLFIAGANQEFETYYNRNLFLVPSGGGSAGPPIPDFPYGLDRAVWSQDGRKVLGIANMGVHSQLVEIDPAAGAFRTLTAGDHGIRGWDFLPQTSQHLVSLDRPSNPGDLWLLGKSEAPLEKVTRVFDYLERDFLLPRQEKISWKGDNGQQVEGLLYYPIDYREGRRYPLVVQTHGGPASSDKFTFGGSTSRYNPVLAAHGYVVLKPNYRGSTGYGNDFLRDMVGHYFHQAHLDVMAGVDHVVELGLADPDRMVKMGWSAGGHMTNKIITFTDRFKAASSGAGAVNWISMYDQSDVRIYRTPWFGGTPWQKDAPIEVYWENSPLKDIAKVKTPTLVLVGENDVRVPPPQSVELYRALKTNGVPTRLYIAPRQPHGWRELRHRLFKINAELDWFARHALGRDHEWETAPAADQEKEAAKPAATTPR